MTRTTSNPGSKSNDSPALLMQHADGTFWLYTYPTPLGSHQNLIRMYGDDLKKPGLVFIDGGKIGQREDGSARYISSSKTAQSFEGWQASEREAYEQLAQEAMDSGNWITEPPQEET